MNEPEQDANLARSPACSRTRAQDKSCGLAAEIQARMEKGAFPVVFRIVSRETFCFREGHADFRIVSKNQKPSGSNLDVLL
ncbi:MAG: hypothetical protein II953_02970 [Clostridia bacterium]|nr:hypothetical protein [Clostridia bacterium]